MANSQGYMRMFTYHKGLLLKSLTIFLQLGLKVGVAT